MTLPLPPFYNGDRLATVWRVPYQERTAQASQWAKAHHIQPAFTDDLKICLLLIDIQNTFCLPEFELSVSGAVEDNQRLCRFIYRNLGQITEICATFDTHQPLQIFHPVFWVNRQGEHPAPNTQICLADIDQDRWRVNPILSHYLPHYTDADLQAYGRYYVEQLEKNEKLDLTIWPYHAMLGGIGHALVAGIEEAIFFHGMARQTQPRLELKGRHPLTENYSVLGAEVTENHYGHSFIAPDRPDQDLIDYLLSFDQIIIAGQAKSHCVAWTIADLLAAAEAQGPTVANKLHILEDCMSPVVVPGVVDFTAPTNTLFKEFGDRGCQRLDSQWDLSV
jgi:nicotinamidase-related amidase